jgi:hypothetical protein
VQTNPEIKYAQPISSALFSYGYQTVLIKIVRQLYTVTQAAHMFG